MTEVKAIEEFNTVSVREEDFEAGLHSFLLAMEFARMRVALAGGKPTKEQVSEIVTEAQVPLREVLTKAGIKFTKGEKVQ
jgi:hypothetical protein